MKKTPNGGRLAKAFAILAKKQIRFTADYGYDNRYHYPRSIEIILDSGIEIGNGTLYLFTDNHYYIYGIKNATYTDNINRTVITLKRVNYI